MWWAIVLITIAISEVHFTSMRRAGLCRDLCEWKNAGGTDGKLQARGTMEVQTEGSQRGGYSLGADR